jgi:TRAP-type C4-dicarboxylate transport system permease small subunit
MAAIIVYDVGMRYFFNKPTRWALEIGQYLMLATTFLPLAHVQKDKKHITVDLFTSFLSTKTRTLLSEFIISPLILLACGGLLWQFGMLSLRLYDQHTVSVSTLRIPLFPVSIILVLGIFFIFVILVIQILGSILDRNSGKTNLKP